MNNKNLARSVDGKAAVPQALQADDKVLPTPPAA
jgi:hypothetical protein